MDTLTQFDVRDGFQMKGEVRFLYLVPCKIVLSSSTFSTHLLGSMKKESNFKLTLVGMSGTSGQQKVVSTYTLFTLQKLKEK